jgi:hypothetical protein
MSLLARVLVLTLSVAACSNSSRKDATTMSSSESVSDSELLARVREVIAARVPADKIADFVGVRPAVDTSINLKIETLRSVDFPDDPDHPNEPMRADEARQIVYWIRPTPGTYTHLVGVQTLADGTEQLFFAMIVR